MVLVLLLWNYVHFLPIWWACSLVAHLIVLVLGEDYGTSNTIAWTIFIVGVVHAFVTEWRRSWAYTDKVTKLAAKRPASKKRVGVIGAGLSGIVTAKELLLDGHEVDLFEKNHDIGGLWNGGMKFGVWDHTISTSSRIHTMFSDFPLAPGEAGTEAEYSIPSRVYLPYLRAFAEHFKVTERIQFNSRIVKVNPLPGNRWELEIDVSQPSEDGSTSSKNVKRIKKDYDYIAVTSGTHAKPVIPEIPGVETFTGRIGHSIFYHTAESFRGRRVLAVGLGESGSDIITEITKVATKCTLSVRNPTYMVPRSFHNRPPDYNDGHNLQSLPPWMRMLYIAMRLNITLIWLPWLYGAKYSPGVHHNFKWHHKLARARDMFKGWPKLASPYVITKSTYIIGELDAGRVELKQGVARIEGSKVHFKDGTAEDYDDIIWFTGLLPNFDFLPEKLQNHGHTDRYLITIHPELPNMGFVGFVRPHIGNIPINAEMQARFVTAIVSDRLLEPLPSKQGMEDFIKYVKATNGCRFPFRVSANLFHNLATRFVGCAPNWFDIFLRDPEAWWTLRNSTYIPAMYRLQGPNSFKGNELYDLMMKEPGNAIPGHRINDVLIFVLNQFVAFYARLPFLKDINEIQPQNTLYF